MDVYVWSFNTKQDRSEPGDNLILEAQREHLGETYDVFLLWFSTSLIKSARYIEPGNRDINNVPPFQIVLSAFV